MPDMVFCCTCSFLLKPWKFIDTLTAKLYIWFNIFKILYKVCNFMIFVEIWSCSLDAVTIQGNRCPLVLRFHSADKKSPLISRYCLICRALMLFRTIASLPSISSEQKWQCQVWCELFLNSWSHSFLNLFSVIVSPNCSVTRLLRVLDELFESMFALNTWKSLPNTPFSCLLCWRKLY